MSDSTRAVGSSVLGPGTVLDGKYEILLRIGAGGMGEVFKARHLHLDAFRCIKVMKQELLADETFRSRFLREARLATQIHHPNIAVVHDFFVGEGGNYMVTEFIEGRTLRQWSGQHGPFPLALAADVASQVLAGLDHIHRRGLLHRDISPDNVMLSFDPDDCCIAKIIDLGIAKDLASSAAADTTQVGVLIGNPKYMSPEQLGLLNDGEQLDGRTDLYSLGVVLYEMLLGIPPFASDSPHGYIMKHLTQQPRRFNDAKPHLSLPEALESVIFRMLEKDRSSRYANAREAAAALAPFLEAPAGTLSAAAVARLRRGPDVTTVSDFVLPPIASTAARDDKTVVNPPSTTTAKERAFERSLLEAVVEREKQSDRDGLQRLAEAHPPGSKVGDAAREALTRVVAEQEKAAEAELAFQRAWEDGRTSAWQEFLAKHGGSDRAEEARRLIAEAEAFEAASRSDSATGMRAFLMAWPDARHHLEAGILLSKLKQRAAEQRAFDDARTHNTAAAWSLYLTAYPNGAHAGEARLQLAKLEKAAAAARVVQERAAAEALVKREPADFDAAFEKGTSEAWDRFVAEHPESPRLAEARSCRQEALDFELANATNTQAMWRAFIKTWPGGRHRIDAEIRLQPR
ncbi:MAG TPA: serine/threonine-protein kinase [Thermoanaerobaculia bacterium]|nr:serine/threonine-protein kinase [Thermoanaerobaculia bacterium]